jgi:hypothetical protein
MTLGAPRGSAERKEDEMTVPEARTAVRTEVVRAEQRTVSISREIGQSVYLMALMAAMLTVYIGLGLLAVRLFG